MATVLTANCQRMLSILNLERWGQQLEFTNINPCVPKNSWRLEEEVMIVLHSMLRLLFGVTNLRHLYPKSHSSSIDQSSRMLEFRILKHTAKWRLGWLVPCLLPVYKPTMAA
jgi:hypothetical protein